MAGNYKRIKSLDEDISLFDVCDNPWNCFRVLDRQDSFLLAWLRKVELLPSEGNFYCEKCNGDLYITGQSGILSERFRCRINTNHQYTVTYNSFFYNGKVEIRDVFLFVDNYVNGHLLKTC